MNDLSQDVVESTDLAFGSDPHEAGMSFDELLDESTNAQKPIPEECSPVTLLFGVEEKVSQRSGNPVFHVTGTVTSAAGDDPRNGKSIVGREIRFYLTKFPKGFGATEAARWVLGAKQQIDVDMWPKDTGKFPDYSLLTGKELTGDIFYSGGQNGTRPFASFRPVIEE